MKRATLIFCVFRFELIMCLQLIESIVWYKQKNCICAILQQLWKLNKKKSRQKMLGYDVFLIISLTHLGMTNTHMFYMDYDITQIILP